MSEYRSNKSIAVHGNKSRRQRSDEATATTTGGGLHRDDSQVEREDSGTFPNHHHCIRCPCCEREYTLPSKRCELQNEWMHVWIGGCRWAAREHPSILSCGFRTCRPTASIAYDAHTGGSTHSLTCRRQQVPAALRRLRLPSAASVGGAVAAAVALFHAIHGHDHVYHPIYLSPYLSISSLLSCLHTACHSCLEDRKQRSTQGKVNPLNTSIYFHHYKQVYHYHPSDICGPFCL